MNSKVLSDINSKMISKTFKYFSFRSLKNNEIVYPKGHNILEKLCVVIEGNIVDKKINKIEAKRNEILYEKNLSEGSSELLKNNLIAEPDCILAEIDFNKFKELLGGDLKTAQVKSHQNEIQNRPKKIWYETTKEKRKKAKKLKKEFEKKKKDLYEDLEN